MLKELQDPIFIDLDVYTSFISLWNRSNANRVEANTLFYLIVNFIDQKLDFVNKVKLILVNLEHIELDYNFDLNSFKKAIFYSIIQHLQQICLNNTNFESKQNKLAVIFSKLIFKVHGKIENRTRAIDLEIMSFLIKHWKIIETNR